MEFGYFTLGDNHYENNTRSANQFVAGQTLRALGAHQDQEQRADEEMIAPVDFRGPLKPLNDRARNAGIT